MTFNDFWLKQREREPEEPKMISLCKILQGSGEDKEEITKLFLYYMELGVDYDEGELPEMVDYLLEISRDKI